MTYSLFYAFMITFFAGLATGIGALVVFFIKKVNTNFLSFALGFSAGVMIYVSFVEILPKARIELVHLWGNNLGGWLTVGAFLGGILLIAIIDKFVPSANNPHELSSVQKISEMNNICTAEKSVIELKRIGILTALAVTIHNFPEGLATFMTSLKDINMGIAIAVAIAIHNIPEGIAVAVPIYYSTGSRKKAFWYAFLSGLAEPLGAVIGYFLLRTFFSPNIFGIVFAGTAGIMVFISLDELLPTAEKFGEHHLCIYGVILGMAVMAISLLLFI